jgi:hypothetical protein
MLDFVILTFGNAVHLLANSAKSAVVSLSGLHNVTSFIKK